MSTPPEDLHQRHVILSKDTIVKRLTDVLQKQPRGDPLLLSQSRPEDHMRHHALTFAMRRSPGRTAWAIGAPLGMGIVTWAILAIGFTLPTAMEPGGPSVAGLIAATVIALVATAVMLASSISANFHQRDSATIEAYAKEAPHVALNLLQSSQTGPELEENVAFLCALSPDVRTEMADIRRRVSATIYAIRIAHNRARGLLGTASTAGIDADAASAIMTTITSARRDMATIDAEIRERDSNVALPVAQEFSVRMAQLASGTAAVTGSPKPAVIGNAVASRIVENARKALEIDPDMTDDGGARVDALVDEHLPSLLKRHADAARHARVEDLLSINSDLENGIELIRRSVEEGLSRVRTTKAEALRTEIAFLKSRRGENDPRLSAIPEGDRHVG